MSREAYGDDGLTPLCLPHRTLCRGKNHPLLRDRHIGQGRGRWSFFGHALATVGLRLGKHSARAVRRE